MTKDPSQKRDEALSFLVGQTTGVLATVSEEGLPRARLVYYTCDDSFNVYFITFANTRKAADLARNQHAAFVIFETETPQTLQVEGDVTDLTDTATIDSTLEELTRILMTSSKYGAPLTRFDPSTLRLFKITPTWVRWGDFTFGESSAEVFSIIDTADTSEEK